MIDHLRYLLHHPRLQAIAAAIGAMSVTLLGVTLAGTILFWALIGIVALPLIVALLWVLHRRRKGKLARRLSPALTETAPPPERARRGRDPDLEALRGRMRAAVQSIRGSRLGQLRGREALYELPWYMIIGSPASGKSSAIVRSGLRFPFADERGPVVQGIGGTRNCDWYFTTEGILLDTAGRYAVREDNRREWLGFLDLLRRHRRRAPVNGIIIAASIGELATKPPEFAIELATSLRQRVQELTERLEVIAPIYVVFTKADLIAGFGDFFGSLDETGRGRVWGATLPFSVEADADVAGLVHLHFDELKDGLREMGLAQMARTRDAPAAPSLLTLPLEFAGLKPIVKTFVATLFEENPYQYRPIFRGFYFTSALQEQASVHRSSERIARRFHLAPVTHPPGQAATTHGYFLNGLFRKVIFADRNMVQQYSTRQRRRTRSARLIGTAGALGLILGAWAWSYTSNRQLIRNAQADLAQAVSVQRQHLDLRSRLAALQILQDRLHQLQTYRDRRPAALGFGLYRGADLERRLRAEYFAGMRTLMLTPASEHLERYLHRVTEEADRLRVGTPGGVGSAPSSPAATPYQAPSPVDARDAYNALKAYLMLEDPRRAEPLLLSGQLTRFWRSWLEANRGSMTREQLIASAQRLMSFYVTQYREPDWPVIDGKVTLVEGSRAALRQVMRGMSAIERAYAQIMARASSRYPTITVASVLGGGPTKATLVGSQPVPGPYTRAAWEGYVRTAIADAANRELSTTDWVLQSTDATDLTLTGSPEHIQKQLRARYDADYIQHWQTFVKGIDVARFTDFADAVRAMNELGDPRKSPLATVLHRVYAETSWETAPTAARGAAAPRGWWSAWFARTILRRPADGTSTGDTPQGGRPDQGAQVATAGTIGSAFAGVAQALTAHDGRASPFTGYLEILGKLRVRLAAIANAGASGPGARALMGTTLDEGQSELSAGLQWVDEQMLNGLGEEQRDALRPLFLRPLIETFRALIAPAGADVNTIWRAQVYEPFERELARKYPFDRSGRVQATDSEIAAIFGPRGAIATFTGETLAPLVRRRGGSLSPRQWAGMGVELAVPLMTDYARWTAPLDRSTGAGDAQTVFQIQPLPAGERLSGYTIHINGQELEYRNTPPVWTSFVWSGREATPLAAVRATTFDGRSVTVEYHAGPDALSQLFRAASGGLDRQTGIYSLSWSRDDIRVSVRLRIVSSPQATADGSPRRGLAGTRLPASVVGPVAGATAAAHATERES